MRDSWRKAVFIPLPPPPLPTAKNSLESLKLNKTGEFSDSDALIRKEFGC